MPEKEQTEKLLLPRYLVIADYPGSMHLYALGEILQPDESMPGRIIYHTCKLYPHLFKRLEWWESRELSEMPEYLKQTGMVDGADNPIPDWYLKVKKHFNAGNGEWRDDSIHIFCTEDCRDGCSPAVRSMSYSEFEPATESEYLEYIKQNKY